MIAIGIKVLEDNLDNLISRLEDLKELEAHVGVTEKDGQHYSGMSYVELGQLHATGVPSKNIPARDIAEWSLLTFNTNNKKIKQGLQAYLTDIHKKKAPITAKDFGEIWADQVYSHSMTMFGNTTYLESNEESTISMKGRDDPMVWKGDLQETWGVTINGQKVN